MDRNILVIGDLHAPFCHKNYLKFCQRIHKYFKCAEVVHIGDLVDNHSISYHEHSPELWSPLKEMEKTDKVLKQWFKAFPKLKLCKGNHDCYCEETEILTLGGWKKGIDLCRDEYVATLNITTNEIEYQLPSEIILKDYNGEMIKIKSDYGIDLLVTPSHRMLVSSKETKIEEPIYSFKKAHQLNNAYRYFAVSGENKKTDYDIDDNIIRLLGWVLTDGSQSFYRCTIYQSKQKNLDTIRNILKSLKIKYVEKVRHRDITHICGKELKNTPLPQHEFSFSVADNEKLSILIRCKSEMPHQVKNFSKRQFDIFINSVLDGDGTKLWETKSPDRNSCVLYGTKEFLEKIQQLCVNNMHMANLVKYRENDWKLNIVRNKIKVGLTNKIECVEYKGQVWCATVLNTTLVVRRNGIVSIQGNCLVDRKGKTVGLPKRCFKPFREIWNLPKGWVDGFEFIIDDVLYKHGTGYSGKYSHIQAAMDSRMSTVIGHTHSVCGVQYIANERQIIFGMNVGCGISRKSLAFAYGKDFKRKPIVSVGVVSYTKKGTNAMVLPMEMK